MDTLLEVWELTGSKPTALVSQPSLDFVEKFYLEIFDKVSKYRHYTQTGPLPIPVESALQAYCGFYGIHNVEQRERIAYMIEALDNAYLSRVWQENEKKAK